MLIGLQRFLQHPQAVKWVFVLAMVLVLPSLWAGLFADDYGHLLRLTQPSLFPLSHFPDLYHLFVFIIDNPQWRELQYSYSLLPWWTESQLQVAFFRPLAELSHAFDADYLRPYSSLMHVHSLVWYALLLLMLHRFYHELSNDNVFVVLSFLLFAVDASHGFTVAWLANRNALMAGFFVLLSVGLFIRSRNNDKAGLYVLSHGCFVLALLCGELGISVLAFIVAYSVVLEKYRGWRAYRPLLPFMAIVCLYLGFYYLAGFGAKGSFYLDPRDDIYSFLSHLLPRFFTAFSMQFNLLPLHLLDRFPTLVSFCGVFIFVGLSFYVWISRNRLALFFLLSTTLLIFPAALAPMQERNLLIAGFASSALLALLLQFLFAGSAKLGRGLAVLILIFHLPVSALGMLAMSYAPAIVNKPAQAMADSMPSSWQDKHIIAIGVPMFDAAFMPLVYLWQGGILPKSIWQLSAHTEDLRVQQIAEQSWLLENPKGLLQGADFLLRDTDKNPLQVSQRISMGDAYIDIKAVDQRGIPIAIIFTIKDITVADWQWVEWQKGRWQVFRPMAIVDNIKDP